MSGSKITNCEERDALLEQHRYINVEHDDWWDCVYSAFEEDMREVGIDVRRMYFSGFWSQGDGACFEGGFANINTYLDKHHQDQFPMIRKFLEHGGSVYADSSHTGRYYHSNSVTISVEATERFYHVLECPTEFHEQVADQWDVLLDVELTVFEGEVDTQWRTYMDELYRRLEEEYDYLVSDEAVWETIEVNELNIEEAA